MRTCAPAAGRASPETGRTGSIVKVAARSTSDVVMARISVRKLAADLGFSRTQQARIATGVSEIARNVLAYAGVGEMIARTSPRGLRIEVWEEGPGIPTTILEQFHDGTNSSKTGMGKGILGTGRMMDELPVISMPGQTLVFMKKMLPRR